MNLTMISTDTDIICPILALIPLSKDMIIFIPVAINCGIKVLIAVKIPLPNVTNA